MKKIKLITGLMAVLLFGVLMSSCKKDPTEDPIDNPVVVTITLNQSSVNLAEREEFTLLLLLLVVIKL